MSRQKSQDLFRGGKAPVLDPERNSADFETERIAQLTQDAIEAFSNTIDNIATPIAAENTLKLTRFKGMRGVDSKIDEEARNSVIKNLEKIIGAVAEKSYRTGLIDGSGGNEMSEVTGRFPSADKIQKSVDSMIDFQKKQDPLSNIAIVNAFKDSVVKDAPGLIGSDINTSDWDGGDI